MEKELVRICAEGMSFFGRTNRLISHELKNILAIISETSGLVEELFERAAEGMEVKPEKLRALGQSLVAEVERANGVVRCLNAFAHSVDEFVCTIDLKESIALAVRLFRLNSAFRQVRIGLQDGAPHRIESSPFFLTNLLQAALHFALCTASAQNEIEISIDSTAAGASVTFYGIRPGAAAPFPNGSAALLAQALAAVISIDPTAGSFRIVFPKKLADGPLRTLPPKEQQPCF